MLSDTVGERITTWRKRRGFNRQRLARECARLGVPELTLSALTNIESGRRQQGVRRRAITVDEVAVIAYALDVPPLLFLLPYPDADSVDLLPGGPTPWHIALDWLTGHNLPPEGLTPDNTQTTPDRDTWLDAAEPLALARTHTSLLELRLRQGGQLANLLAEAEKEAEVQAPAGEHADPGHTVRAAMNAVAHSGLVDQIEDTDRLLVGVRDQMQAKGYPLPPLPAELRYLHERSATYYHQPLAHTALARTAAPTPTHEPSNKEAQR